MRRIVFLATFSLMVWLVLAPAAVAQDEQYSAEEEVEQQFQEQLEEQVEAPVDVEVEEEAAQQIQEVEQQVGEEATIPVQGPVEEQIEQKAEEQGGEPVEITVQEIQPKEEQPKMEGTMGPLPKSGGPAFGALLLPAAALLLGSGVVAYSFLRRR